MSAWCELVVEGDERVLRAFVAGFTAGRRARPAGVFGRDCGLEPDSLGERLKALFAGGSHHVYLAPRELAEALARALATQGAAVGLRVERRQVVESIRVAFRVEAFSRSVAAAIRRDILRKLPAGVTIERLSEREAMDPSAHGTELYAPEHEYVYRASGEFVGQPPAIFDARRRAAGRDFVSIDAMEVRTKAR